MFFTLQTNMASLRHLNGCTTYRKNIEQVSQKYAYVCNVFCMPNVIPKS